ncbi:MAG TPA: glutamine synthetase type III [Lachnospiraceae bacterium]|nr:glutamine synthetase type III [Lachnospiraceae bacterium]
MSVPEIFGSMVFNDAVMREKLPKDIYRSLKKTIEDGRDLDIAVANVVAIAMKDWAIEKGATHFTHWFQPMTGVTAEKHDSFISPQDDGRVIMEFSGKELIKGEPDASSFPSGGLRATFEARGYTAWDPTSYAFVKDDVLCIPTAFCSYGGESLDKKTPLLRSMEALSEQAVRILRLFGNEEVRRVVTTVGPEQEYFLIDRSLYEKRKDLIYCGRTLFGARPPKGQELDDHYFGAIKPRVQAFMKELNGELWRLGILAKTEHNEAAPAQHEMAPIYDTANIAIDHNQITMEVMKKVAKRHNFICLLHEKPFEGINGSGKHNNWSMVTDHGTNLLEPGRSPHENAQFLLFITAIIKAVDEYQDLLRLSIASAGNDHRLGAAEAPPAIMSIFLGDDLDAILKSIESGMAYSGHGVSKMDIGVHVLPKLPKDTTDRNRTSPFAFTGNKFEFRSCGSSMSVSGPNTVLNTIVAESLRQFADELEGAEGDFTEELYELLRRTLKKHKRIIFNGDGYSKEWEQEARGRGLLNLPTTVDALPRYLEPKNIELFKRHHIFTEIEVRSRYEIELEAYSKLINIEGLTAVDMAKKEILPAVNRYVERLLDSAEKKQRLSGIGFGRDICCQMEKELITLLSELEDKAYHKVNELEALLSEASALDREEGDRLKTAAFYKDRIIPVMNELRGYIDTMESNTDRELWPLPSYGEMLFSV